jgi:hypothetical protein
MFTPNLFKINHQNKTIVAMADDLATIRGPGALFEKLYHKTEDWFGFAVNWNGRGGVATYVITKKIEKHNRITYMMEPLPSTKMMFPSLADYMVVVVAKYH